METSRSRRCSITIIEISSSSLNFSRVGASQVQEGSRLAVGSSRIRSEGSSPARSDGYPLLSPPERVWSFRSFKSSAPTAARAKKTFRISCGVYAGFPAKATSSLTVSVQSCASGSCCTRPTIPEGPRQDNPAYLCPECDNTLHLSAVGMRYKPCQAESQRRLAAAAGASDS